MKFLKIASSPFEKLIFATLMAAGLAAPAMASDWVRVTGNKATNHYLDLSSVQDVGSGKKVAWDWSVARVPGFTGAQSIKARKIFDCRAGSTQTTSVVGYGPDGSVMGSDDGIDLPAFSPPASVGDFMLKFVCAGAGGKIVDDPRADAAARFARQ